MKKPVILLHFLCAVLFVNAQDIIITKSGDTIKCQITKVTHDNIFFRYLKAGNIERSKFPVADIADYQYFRQDLPKQAGGVPPDRKYPRIRLGIGAGYTYRIEKIPDNAGDYEDYFKKMKSGFNIEAEAGYFFKKSFGVGLRYNFFRTSNYLDDVVFIINDGHIIDTVTGNMGDDIRIQYIEPIFYYRFFNRSGKIAWLAGVSIGYASYINKGLLMDEDMEMRSSTVGISVVLGADIFLTRNIALGLSASADIGTLTKITIDYKGTKTTRQLPIQDRIDISLINITAGIRFWK